MSADPNSSGEAPHSPANLTITTDDGRPETTRFPSPLPPTPVSDGNDEEEFYLQDAPVENTRPIRVIVIGAGFSGVYLGIRIPERLRNVELVIYDKNSGIGGTWWENRYPGCACDIPSHSYQYSFEPNPNWSSLYAPSSEICDYITGVAHKYGADRFIQLQHEVTECTWDEAIGNWRVKVQDLRSGVEKEDAADVLISARGLLNNVRWPTIDGLDEFKGELLHSARWNESYDYSNKRIGVIGIGSSAIQIIPVLQKLPGAQLTSFSRGRTWISPPFSSGLFNDQYGLDGVTIPSELRERFRNDPDYLQEFRQAVESDGNSVHIANILGTPMQKAGQAAFADSMRERLASRPDILDRLLPSFAPGCKRLTPGIGFLEALCAENVNFVQDHIVRVEQNGVRTEDGTLHELDVLVCATGFHTSTAPPFPIYGDAGRALSDRWANRPETYLSMAVDGFPNLWMLFGPNGGGASGSLTRMIEATGEYVVKGIRKLQRENIKKMEVKHDRVRDFLAYTDAFMAKTVFMGSCKTWYRHPTKKVVTDSKGEKKEVETEVVTALWPGGTLHLLETLKSPRWEDYEYEYVHDPVTGRNKNPLSWLGNGFAIPDIERTNLGWYLDPAYIEKPVAHRPEDNDVYRKTVWAG